jgi:hypothetical protein
MAPMLDFISWLVLVTGLYLWMEYIWWRFQKIEQAIDTLKSAVLELLKREQAHD